MIVNEKINKTNFFFTESHNSTNLGEYYSMICEQLKKTFNENDFPFEVNFGNPELKKDINLDFQYEHTIVKKNNVYRYNIHRYEYLSKLDCIFEYTQTNIQFLSNFNKLSEYVSKNIYVPPLIYDELYFSDVKDRYLDFTTLQNWSKRRSEFFIKRYHDNITGSCDKFFIKNNLDNYKVLLNIHQIDNHKSFEELRVLPALSTGILVISEDVPFRKSIPYHKHIIWTSYEKMEQTLDEVLRNYDFHREKMLDGIFDTLEEMKKDYQSKILNFFKNINHL